MWNEINFKSLAIVGSIRTGKTCLAYDIIRNYDMDKYIYLHPKPKLIEKLGFKQFYGFAELERIKDCILWIDEPQLYLKLQSGGGQRALQRLLSLCGQRNIKLILSTSDTRVVVKGIEFYIDVWCVKDLEYKLVKHGSLLKEILKDYCTITTDGFRLNVDEYIFYSRNFRKYNGKHTFKKPEYFTEELSRPYY